MTSATIDSTGRCTRYADANYSLLEEFSAILAVVGPDANDPWEAFNPQDLRYNQANPTGGAPTILAKSKNYIKLRLPLYVEWKTDSNFNGSVKVKTVGVSNGIDFVKSLTLPTALTFSKATCKSFN